MDGGDATSAAVVRRDGRATQKRSGFKTTHPGISLLIGARGKPSRLRPVRFFVDRQP